MKEFIRKYKYCFLHLLYPLYWSITYSDKFLNMVHLLPYSRYVVISFDYRYTSLYTQSFWDGRLIDTELITKLASLITELKNE